MLTNVYVMFLDAFFGVLRGVECVGSNRKIWGLNSGAKFIEKRNFDKKLEKNICLQTSVA